MAELTDAVLELRSLRKGYDPAHPVIDIAQFRVHRGEQIALAGPSGSGKTTLLNLISGILDPDQGEVLVDGVDITTLPGRSRDLYRGKKIGFVFQTFNLLQGFTAFENLLAALMFGGRPKSEHPARARLLLERVGLADHMHRRPAQLSVGQQQRVGLARALVNDPPLVLADEPAAQLDQANAENVVRLLRDMCLEGRNTLIVVAHDQVVLSQFRTLQMKEISR
jgi:putative ABC transport system ATP-binding protein